MKKIILTPNPYRDKGFQTVRTAVQILRDSGMDPRVCLPFEVDKAFDLPKDIHFYRLDREIREADMIIVLHQQWKSRALCLAHLADASSIGFLALQLCL